MAKDPKTTADSTANGTPSKVPQPHGGALNSGGTKGNKGGRPPSWFRERVRELLTESTNIGGRKRARIEFAAAVMDGKVSGATVSDRMMAWRELMRVGVPAQAEVSGVDGGPIEVREMSDEDLRKRAAALTNRLGVLAHHTNGKNGKNGHG